MTCPHCVARVEQAARDIQGVNAVTVNLETGIAALKGGNPEAVIQAITQAGYPAAPLADNSEQCPLLKTPLPTEPAVATNENSSSNNSDESSYLIGIDDMICASCVANVEKAILSTSGVTQGVVNLIEKIAHALASSDAT